MKVTTIIIIILSACILYKLLSSKEEGFVLENPNYTSDSNAANNTYGIITDPVKELNNTNLVPVGYPAGATNARFSYQKAEIKDPNVKTEIEAINGGNSCAANSPSYFPTTVYFQVPPVNATCATDLSILYSTLSDSHSVCNINQNNVWFKQGTLKSDTQITSSASQYGGLTCTEQNTSTKPIQCGPIDAVCTTGDAAYDIPSDSTSVCAASSTAPRDFYKTGTRKADTSITTTAAKNSGKTCTSQLAATVTKMCTKVNATPSSPLTLINGELSDAFYNFNADSFNECNLNKNGLWYKRGTLKQDSAITSSNALYGGLTVTEQINALGSNFGTKDKLCGAIQAKCRTDSDNVISNYTVNQTPISGSSLLTSLTTTTTTTTPTTTTTTTPTTTTTTTPTTTTTTTTPTTTTTTTTPTTTTTGKAQKYTLYTSKDMDCSTGQCILQNDGTSKRINKTADQCAADCDSDTTCKAFTHYPKTNECWLLNGAIGSINRTGSNIYTKPAIWLDVSSNTYTTGSRQVGQNCFDNSDCLTNLCSQATGLCDLSSSTYSEGSRGQNELCFENSDCKSPYECLNNACKMSY